MKNLLKLKLLFLLLFSFLFNNVFAQKENNSSRKEIAAFVGYDYGYYKDLNFSPLNYKIKGVAFSLKYNSLSRNGNSIFSAAVNFAPINLHSKASQYFITSDIIGKVELSYLRKIKKSSNKYALFLGGQYSSDVHFVDYEGLRAFSFLFAHTLDVKGVLQYQINENHFLKSSLSIPVFGNIVRPPFGGFDKELDANRDKIFRLITNGDFGSFNKYIAFDWSTEYAIQLSKKWDFKFLYSLIYQRTPGNQKLITLQNRIHIGAAFKF